MKFQVSDLPTNQELTGYSAISLLLLIESHEIGNRSLLRWKGVEMLFPLSDGVWAIFFRGMVFGFFGGLVLILLFFWGSGKYGALAVGRPIGFVYFLAGLEIGIALIGAIVFLGLHAFHDWGQRMLDQSKRSGAS